MAVYNDLVLSGKGVSLDIYNGDSAYNTTVRNSAKLRISAGGYVESTTVLNSTTVSNAGSALFTFLSGGTMMLYNGAVAETVSVLRNARLTVSTGARATGLYVSSGNVNATVLGGDETTLVTGVNEKGDFFLSGGVASNFIIYDGGAQQIFSGGTALHTLVSGQRAFQNVWSGGAASATSVYKNGIMEVYESGIARDILVYSGGSMVTRDGADVSGATVSGVLLVESASTGEGESGGSAVISDIRIVSGGSMKVVKGASFQGEIALAGDVTLTNTMTLADGASLTLDVSVRGEASPAILNDWAQVAAAPDATYELSVSVRLNQALGNYKLADNAGTFDRTVTVKSGEMELGSITVGGEALDRGGYAYSLSLDDALLMLTVAKGTPVPRPAHDDLNADGRADVVMTIADPNHPADGSTGAWLIQADQTAEWGDLSQRNAGWEIFGMGVTSAGKTTNDVYIKSTGNVVGAWTTNAVGEVDGWVTVGEFDADTQVLGLGDFNGDGQTDLLLRNVNGAVGCYFTSGDKLGWNYFQSLGNEWSVVAAGDLNGDGRDDVVLKNDAGGFAGSWLTQEDYTMGWANLDTLESGYSIVGCGDFDGDGTDDVLLRNGTYFGAWIVEDGSVAEWMGLGDLGGVSIEQIGDFDADGIDDLRIRTAAGDLGAQLVKGEDDLTWKYYGSVGAEWSTALTAI